MCVCVCVCGGGSAYFNLRDLYHAPFTVSNQALWSTNNNIVMKMKMWLDKGLVKSCEYSYMRKISIYKYVRTQKFFRHPYESIVLMKLPHYKMGMNK